MITIELYLTRKEVMALQAQGLSDPEIGQQLNMSPELIPRIVAKELYVDFRLTSASSRRGVDFGALLPPLDTLDRDTRLRTLVYGRIKRMGYHFSPTRLAQIYDTALRDAK